jgi:hypothetical protein
MMKKNTVALQDLMGVLFRGNPEDQRLENTHGLWYVLSNTEMGIQTRNNTNHTWLRLMGIKVVEKDGIPFDPVVEPVFLRTSNPGEPQDCIKHNSHPHASPSGCLLYRDSYVWLNVDRTMEPNIREYEKTQKLDSQTYLCVETDPLFINSFLFWLSEQGAKYDLTGTSS